MTSTHHSSGVTTRVTTWQYWWTRLRPRVQLTPRRIALGYLTLGVLALYVSDVLLVRYLDEPVLSQAQAFKGGAEVLLTTLFIFVLVDRRDAQLKESNADLDRQREELQVLHRVLRHNLRNDLCVIQMTTEWICEHLPPDVGTEECRRVSPTVEDIGRYVEQASRINRLGLDGAGDRSVDLAELISDLLADHPDLTEGVVVETSIPDAVRVEVHPLFREALSELVANAVTHNDRETPVVRLSVDANVGPRHLVEVTIADNGPGLSPAQRRTLRGSEQSQMHHLDGLGLWFVKWTLRHSNGELEFDEGADGGTIVRARVPKAPEMLVRSVFSR